MVAQGRGGQLDVLLNLPRRGPLRAALDDETKDRQTHRIAECAELFRVVLEISRGHVANSTYFGNLARCFRGLLLDAARGDSARIAGDNFVTKRRDMPNGSLDSGEQWIGIEDDRSRRSAW